MSLKEKYVQSKSQKASNLISQDIARNAPLQSVYQENPESCSNLIQKPSLASSTLRLPLGSYLWDSRIVNSMNTNHIIYEPTIDIEKSRLKKNLLNILCCSN